MYSASIVDTFESIDSTLANLFTLFYDNPLQMNVIYALAAAGIVFTIWTRGVQLRFFPAALKAVFSSRADAEGGISSFQAFAIGLASRVGTGNIAGVAIAIVLGGPGAVFWMWIVAILGMSTAFIEAVLAQLFKIRSKDGSFRGGPAYYIRDALGSKRVGAVFAIFLIFAYGFSFNMVQANTISNVVSTQFNVPTWSVALVLLLISAPIIFAGIKPVARFAEVLAPSMAIAYILFAVVIIGLNVMDVPAVLVQIVHSAFGWDQVVGGGVGGFMAALTNGVKRGLFSNEAGMGSVPNAAATATVRHPVQQGLIQTLGVFVDTMIVCTATACIILFSGLYNPGMSSNDGAALTVEAISTNLGTWVEIPMAIIIFVFGYSSVLGNYTYAEINWNYLRGMNASTVPLKALVLVSVGLGSVISLKAAWNLADIATAFMTMLNIVALFLLGRYAVGALRDWVDQRRFSDAPPVFCVTDNKYFPQGLRGSTVWSREAVEQQWGEIPRYYGVQKEG
ncbi:alanine/glycine:cation symporter family protein [Gleimia hominis]|uniref:Alanine/glycine:cation symporter family protein n=1 Tax=Gleimia hominis TaxID=595468 RepID=A0ABU3IC61_9ACTO|nr:alanine/glycine:cation symporter family protein [Gleimia hominis]MDT3767957.1 alanine/glycine:cation symporter family protein [Gleimia hominis]